MTADAWTLELPDADATRRLGRAVGAALAPGLAVALVGDLGAGKTALAKAAIEAQGAVEEDDVTSPTFVIAVEYPGRVPVTHVDAYRLEGPGALEALDLVAPDRALLVEWADRVLAALPADRLEVALEHRDPGRRATLRATGPRARAALGAVRAAVGGDR